MYGKMQGSGLIEIIPLICTSATWGQYSAFLHPESPQGAQLGVTAVAQGLAVGSLFVSILSSLKAHSQGGCNVMA